MGLRRLVAAIALGLGIAGSGMAQQTPASPEKPAREYTQQFLLQGSWFHGVHGLAFNKDDQLFAGSVIGQRFEDQLGPGCGPSWEGSISNSCNS